MTLINYVYVLYIIPLGIIFLLQFFSNKKIEKIIEVDIPKILKLCDNLQENIDVLSKNDETLGKNDEGLLRKIVMLEKREKSYKSKHRIE